MPIYADIENDEVFVDTTKLNLFGFGVADGNSDVLFRLHLPVGKSITVYWGDGAAEIIDGIGFQEDYDAANQSPSVPDTAYNIQPEHTYDVPGQYEIGFEGDVEELRMLFILNGSNLTGNINHWVRYLPKAYTVIAFYSPFDADVSDWHTKFPESQVILFNGATGLIGDISDMYKHPTVTIVNFINTGVHGDISNYADGNLTSINFTNCIAVTGDLTRYKDMPSKDSIRQFQLVGLPNITADMTDWRFPAMAYAYMSDTPGFSGDISGWMSVLTTPTVIRFYGTSCEYNTQASWNNVSFANFYAYDCNWTSAMVDNCLIAMAGGPVYDTAINIGGNNAARTTASDAAKATLETNGCTITVNE